MRAAVFDAVADDETLLGRLGRGDAAGHDPDPGLQLGRVLGAVGGDGRDELEAGPHGPLGVVLLRDRGAPDRHDGVADELLDDAAVAGDDGPGELEVAGEELSYLLGVSLFGERREADEVAEQHRDVAQLGAVCLRGPSGDRRLAAERPAVARRAVDAPGRRRRSFRSRARPRIHRRTRPPGRSPTRTPGTYGRARCRRRRRTCGRHGSRFRSSDRSSCSSVGTRRTLTRVARR